MLILLMFVNVRTYTGILGYRVSFSWYVHMYIHMCNVPNAYISLLTCHWEDCSGMWIKKYLSCIVAECKIGSENDPCLHVSVQLTAVAIHDSNTTAVLVDERHPSRILTNNNGSLQ